jgi:hypothetical protein
MLIVSFGVGSLTFQIIINIGKRPPMPTSGLALADPKRVHTTGSFPVGQLNSRQESFVAFGNVPIAEFRFVEMPARYPPFNPSNDVQTIDGGVPQSSPSFQLD